MSSHPVQRILGSLLMAFSFFMLPPLFLSYFYGFRLTDDPFSLFFLVHGDGGARAFILGFAIIFLAGVLLWYPARAGRPGADGRELKIRDGFLVVSAFWLGLGIAGAVPLMASDSPHMPLTDAVFESISGLTTTGATVLTGLDDLPRSVLFYRQLLQWLGGMGIIVLAVAILPMLGIGGMQLYRAETPGPVKDSKLTPRIAKTAKSLWLIYLIITVLCALSYWAAGMDVFDAVCHSFSTVAIGGFSTHDASVGIFDSAAIEYVAIVFMLVAGVNFSLHFLAWERIRISLPLEIRGWRPRLRARRRSFSATGAFRHYAQDSEFHAYVRILAALALVTIVYLYMDGQYATWSESFRKGLFQVVSIGTTTGFTTADFSIWHGAVPVMLIFASFIGGCAGSTGGGMKVIRWVLIFKQGYRELIRLLHPNAEIPVKLSGRPVPPRVIEAVWGFFSAYVVVFALMLMGLMFTGLDQITAFSAVAASLNNLGPGLGDVASNYSSLTPIAKWICVLAMVMGRLEIFTLLVLVTGEFWRR
ncbi:MAG: TrkH family potassium uptake protein [Gammaproteobacteria bacterium]